MPPGCRRCGGGEHVARGGLVGSARRGGKGLGIREGVRAASGDIIGFTDADNKTPITEFDKVRPFLDAGYEVIVGSRGLGESRIERPQPGFRRVGIGIVDGGRYCLMVTQNFRN